jgi:hypothetical protein
LSGNALRQNAFWPAEGIFESEEEIVMRKTILTLASVGALALATPALAQQRHHHQHPGWVAPAAGVATGAVIGIGLYEGWIASSSLATASSTAAGSAAIGGVAGIGTAALIHAAITPCTGFYALAGGPGCVNGQYVGHRVR